MEQAAVIDALSDPGFYPHHPDRVDHVQTHISHVLIAGPYVYKLKKAVRFPFLDFSTTELRHSFCVDEVRLNRRLSPDVYLDVLPITREPDGTLRLGGAGIPVEHVVRMRRLPADRMLVTLLARGSVTDDMIDALAARIATFHAEAPTDPTIAAYGDPDALRAGWVEETRGTATFAGDLLPIEDHEILADFGPAFIRTHEALLRKRQAEGRIREGHGDLHAEHVCFVDASVGDQGLPAGIYVFDCIEFSRAFRCNDVASEVAFLAMDLESLGHPELARRFVESYVAAAGDPAIPALVPFYASYFAGVRGKVEGLESREPEVDASDRKAAAARARGHFALAVRNVWSAAGPALIACCGLSGTGKTALAREIATATGATLLSSDVLRRRDAGTKSPEVASYGAGRYGSDRRAAVYETLCAQADIALAQGHWVVADATFLRGADRARLVAAAARQRRPLLFVECEADEAVVRARLEARDGASVSDARWETYLGQRRERERFEAGEPRLAVDTGESLATARTTAIRGLWRWWQGLQSDADGAVA